MNNNEKTAAEVVEASMTEYTRHTLADQLPNPVDGLKRVQRRVVWTLKDISTARKAATVVGRVLSLYHPHGDQSIADTLARLTQWFSTPFPLADGQSGNTGSYAGDPHAAARYLEVARSEFTFDIYYRNVRTASLDFTLSETAEAMEPQQLVPVIPMGLLMSTFGLATAFKATILPLRINNVCRIASKYAELADTIDNPRDEMMKHPEWFVPDSFYPNLLRNSKELMAKARKGVFNARTVYDGTLEVNPGCITIHTLPFGTTPGNLGTLENADSDRNHPLFNYVREVRNSSQDLLNVEVILKQNVDPFKVLDKVKQAVRFSFTRTPSMRWTDTERRLCEYDAVDVVQVWYEARKRFLLSCFKYQQNQKVEELRQLEAKIVVIDHADEVIRLVKQSAGREEAVKVLTDRFSISSKQAGFLADLNLHQLTSRSQKELQQSYEQIRKELAELKDKFTNVNIIIRDEIDRIRKKYDKPRQAKLPDFNGAVDVGTGVIQFRTETELHQTLLEFKPENCNVHLYPPNRSVHRYSAVSETVTDEEQLSLPKQFRNDYFTFSPYKLDTTIVVGKETLFRLDRLVYDHKSDLEFTFVGREFTAVDVEDGYRVKRMSATAVKLRRTVTARGVYGRLIGVSANTGDRLIVVHGNTRESNRLKLEMVTSGDKISRVPVGETVIIGFFRPDEPFFINVPDRLLSRNRTYHVRVDRPEEVMGDRKTVRLDVSRKSTDNGCTLKKDRHGIMCLTA